MPIRTICFLGRVVSFLVLFIALAMQTTWVWSQQTSGKVISKRVLAPGPRWKSYISEKYGFRFLYPPGCSVRKEDDTNYKYIRVQNYSDSSGGVLKPNQFYLEVFVYDPALGHKPSEPCEKAIKDPKRITRGNTVVLVGREEEPEGDPGGYRQLLCARLDRVDLHVSGTEGTWETPIMKAIFKSFRFRK